MSTLTRLSPQIRMARTQRRNLLRFFSRHSDFRTALGRRAIELGSHMKAIHADPGSDGFRKHRLALALSKMWDEALAKHEQEKKDADKRDI